MNVISNPKPAEPQFLLIYTAPGRNPSYRQGVLDAICYPNDQLVSFSYRRKNVDPSFLTDGFRSVIGKEAVIIFVDFEKESGAKYFPVRRVKIYNAFAEKGSVIPDPRERVKLLLQLSDYVDYNDSDGIARWHEIVQASDASRMFVGSTPTYFVISAADDYKKSPNSTLLAWEEIARTLSRSRGFQDASFIKLNHLIRHTRGWFGLGPERVARKHDGDRLAYTLRPGEIYRLDLCILENSKPNSAGGINFEVKASATDSLDVDQPHQSCVSGLNEKSALITCKRSIESITTTITVRAEKKSEDRQVNSASPTLFVRIRVSLPTFILFVIFVFLGGFLLSIDTTFLNELYIPWVQKWPVMATFFSKLVGAGMLAEAAFLAFRRLPSGTR